jgi:hypothetical protein
MWLISHYAGCCPTGDAAVVATAGGQQSQANAFLSVL